MRGKEKIGWLMDFVSCAGLKLDKSSNVLLYFEDVVVLLDVEFTVAFLLFLLIEKLVLGLKIERREMVPLSHLY